MSFLKTIIISTLLLAILLSSSITLIYYSSMRSVGRADEAKERIAEFISSALPDNVKSVFQKVGSSVSRVIAKCKNTSNTEIT